MGRGQPIRRIEAISQNRRIVEVGRDPLEIIWYLYEQEVAG